MGFAWAAAIAGTGTVSCTGTTTVTGTGTNFGSAGSAARLGGTIIVGGVTKTITAIASTTSLTTDTAFGTFTGQAYTCNREIVQTGADTMGTSLGVVTGFNVTNRGDQLRTFDARGNDLTINGVLTVDSTTGQLRNDTTTGALKVLSTASASAELKITGRKVAANNGPFPYAGLDWLGVNGAKIMQLQGTATYPAKLTLQDACIRYGADWITTNSGQYSTITTEGEICWILCGNGTGTNQARLRMDNTTATVNFTAKKTYVGVWLNFGVPQISLKGYTPLNTDGPEINMNSVSVAQRIPIEDYDTTYVVPNYYANSQIVLYGGAWVRLINNLKGTNINYFSQNASASAENVLEFSRKITGTAQDSAGNLLSDGTLYYQPVGSNVANIRPKGVTTDVTFSLTQQVATFVAGVATSEFVYAWGYDATGGVKTTYNYFCTGTTKGAETHTVYSSRYGYDKQPALVTLAGNSEAAETFVHASLPTTDKVIANAAAIAGVTFNFTTKTWTNALGSTLTVQQIYDAYQYQLNQTANLQKPDECVVSGSLRNWVGWTGVNNGTITGGTDDLKIGSTSITGSGTITALYQIGASPSARLTLEGPTDTSIRVSTNTGAEYDFASDVDATYVEYFAPGKIGTWTWIAERLGKQRQSGTFTPGVGGDFAESLIWLDDLGLTETSAAVLAAITDFGDPNEVLNYAAYWRTTQAGIAINKISKDGNAVSWGDANVNWVASAAVPLAYDAATNTFTAVTTGHVAGTTLFSHRTTGLMTFGAGTNFNTAFKDVDGLRVSVTGINPQGFTVTGHLRYRKQGTTTWTNTTYTANTITLLMEEAIYDVQVRCPGYDWKTTEVDAAKTLLLDVGLQYQVSANNTPQYTMPFNAVLEAIFSYDPTSMQVAVANTTGGILQPGFAELYQATQRIMHLSGLVWTWSNPIKANATSQKIIIPNGNPLQMFLTAASNASVKLTCPVIHEDSGQSADDRVRGNASGYSIILGSPATAESAGLQAAIVADILAATLKANIIQVNDVPVTGTGAEGDEWGPSA